MFSMGTGMAQMHNAMGSKLGRHQVVVKMLQRQTEKHLAAKATGIISERVIAQSTRDSVTGPLSDSVKVAYTGNRGSTYDYNSMMYGYQYPYNTTPMFNFNGQYTKPQVLADTMMHWTINPFNLSFGLFEWGYSGYDALNNLSTYHGNNIDSTSGTNQKYVNTFGTVGNILQGDSYVSAAGMWDTAFLQYFQYDGSNRLVKDSSYEYASGIWHLVSRTFYTYDVSGNLIQIDCFGNMTDGSLDTALTENQQYINTYDAMGRLLTVATNLFDGTLLQPSGLDTMAYTGTGMFNTTWREYQYDNINGYWAPQFNMIKSLNSMSLPDTVNFMGFDSLSASWVPNILVTVSYDGYNNPVVMNEFDYNWTSFPTTPTFTHTYYYETYDNTTAVPTPSATETLTLYPNPATNHIVMERTATGAGALVVLDAFGKMVIRQTVAQGATTFTVDVSHLAAGAYWAQFVGADGSQCRPSQFVKW